MDKVLTEPASASNRTVAKILIVEDDTVTREGIALALAQDRHQVVQSASGESALKMIAVDQPDLVILDVSLPDINGFEVCRRLRLSGSDVPIIFLTARAEEIDRVVGLEIGGDDYIVKPFSLRELQARLQVQLRRRARKPSTSRLRFGDLEVDFEKLIATRKGRALDLTPREFEMLRYFAARPGQVVTRDELLSAVWKASSGSTRTVDTHILKLRRKIENDPDSPQRLIAIWGEGYKFIP
jgi:two-component system alkaline phosphatase synthesis response regulator PhoP